MVSDGRRVTSSKNKVKSRRKVKAKARVYNSSDFGEILLEKKKAKVKEVIYKLSQVAKFPMPILNFGRCPLEHESFGTVQLAHYHPDQNKICISRRQLYMQNYRDIENTITHEIAHIFVPKHSPEFEKMKAQLHLKSFGPQVGVTVVNEEVLKALKEQRLHPKQEKEVIDKVRCNYHLCRKKRELFQCPYCKNYFCKEHIKPVVPSGPTGTDVDYAEPDFHPCPEYVEVAKGLKEAEIQAYTDALDIAAGKRTPQVKEVEEINLGNVIPEPVRRMSSSEIEESRKKLGMKIQPVEKTNEKNKAKMKTIIQPRPRSQQATRRGFIGKLKELFGL